MSASTQPASRSVEIWLVRHGETEWSRDGLHTGTTDIPLTDVGEVEARTLARRLDGVDFDHVFSSPRQRALHTCVLAGHADAVRLDDELVEWDYGAFEGRTSAAIREEHADWDVFRHGCPDGESVADVTARADRVLARLAALDGRIALFGHGHFSRVLGARWIGLPTVHGRQLALDTASVSILGAESSRGERAILLWNLRTNVEG